MKCPYCNYENKDDAVCCEHCYAGLQENKPQEKQTEKDSEPVSSFRKRIRS